MIGVNVAIIRSGQILTKREDFEVWCLPGGQVDPGESLAHAAVREAREEVGLHISLTHLVGVYSVPLQTASAATTHVIVFAADVISGDLQLDPDEVLEADYFDPAGLPEPMLAGHRQRISDALHGLGGSATWSQNMAWPFETNLTREELYRLRDQSGLSRQAFYVKHFGHHDPHADVVEIKGQKIS